MASCPTHGLRAEDHCDALDEALGRLKNAEEALAARMTSDSVRTEKTSAVETGLKPPSTPLHPAGPVEDSSAGETPKNPRIIPKHECIKTYVGGETQHCQTCDGPRPSEAKGRWVCNACGNTEDKEREVSCWKCGKGEMIYTRPTSAGFDPEHCPTCREWANRHAPLGPKIEVKSELWDAAKLKMKQLEAQIQRSGASQLEKSNMLHTHSKLCMFAGDAWESFVVRPAQRTNEAKVPEGLPAGEYPEALRMREERDHYRALALLKATVHERAINVMLADFRCPHEGCGKLVTDHVYMSRCECGETSTGSIKALLTSMQVTADRENRPDNPKSDMGQAIETAFQHAVVRVKTIEECVAIAQQAREDGIVDLRTVIARMRALCSETALPKDEKR